ncbi:MAG TPA: hypothetical protein VL492_12805 [Methylovirgula sp.]|nr:hypothetical protein [Methylovirgula sp.]
MMRFALALIFVLFSAPTAFAAGTDKPLANHIELIISTNGVTPFPEEMVVLKVRTILFHGEVTHQELEQPSLENFSWIQLGSDRSYRTMIDGAPAIVFERLLALYPVKSGKLIISSFVYHLALVDNDNVRRKVDLRSPQASVDVGAWTASQSGPTKPNWLPASAFSITDTWNPEPDRLTSGAVAHRTVTIEAKGITADRLPAAPHVHAPGAIIFRGTVERTTTMTPTGPIARAVYRWDLALTTSLPVAVAGVHIPWFDTKSRQMRDAIIPARTLAFAGATTEHFGQSTPSISGFTLAATGFAAFLAAWMILGFRVNRDRPRTSLARQLRTWRELREIRGAARSDDAGRLRSAISALSRRDPAVWQACLETPSVRNGLSALDQYLFGSHSGSRPNLRALSKSIAREWNVAASSGTAPSEDHALSR